MHHRWIVLYFVGLTFLFLSAQAQAQKPQVVGWIPVYGIEKSMQALQENPHIAKGLTRIGLQFWNPSPDGKSVVLAPVDKSGRRLLPADVKRVITWAKRHQIQVLLTVYNNSQVLNHWDWSIAQRAFRDHPSEFIASLMAVVNEYGLDGVDLDLEGEGDVEGDRASYTKFVRDLSAVFRKQHKLLTIDSFHSPCANAPNMGWWRDWLGYVDAIHSMGYQDLYEGSTTSFRLEGKPVCENGAAIFRYSWQLAYGQRLGYRIDQIVLGFPTWLAQWGEGGLGVTIGAHLSEIEALGGGVALWDLQLSAAEWRKAQIGEQLQRLRAPKPRIK